MKKILVSATLLLFALGVKAQQTEYFYQVNGLFKDDRTAGLNGKWVHFKPVTGNGLFIKSDGSVGIGNTSPTEKLDVTGNIHANRGLFTSIYNSSTTYTFSSSTEKFNASAILMAGALLNPASRARTFSFYDIPKTDAEESNVLFNINDRNAMARLRFRAYRNAEGYLTFYDKNQSSNFILSDDVNNNVSLIMPKQSSYVMIGTSSYIDGADVYKLSVGGKIRAHEVKVYTTWADYVFEDDYKLKSLDEVEQFINVNGHLPNVPSAKEVEEKGLEVGNMMKIQQEKIEELTLYLIEQKKENDQLKKDVEELKAAVKTLTNKQ